jgi:hypothetical protein
LCPSFLNTKPQTSSYCTSRKRERLRSGIRGLSRSSRQQSQAASGSYLGSIR